MSSYQHISGSKASVFVEAAEEEEPSMQEEVDKRMNRALEDLKEKYENVSRRQEEDASVNKPNGAAYQELERLREQRKRELKCEQKEKLDNLSKGHGKYEEIVEEEFLTQVLKSRRVVVHFYHNDFENCKVMDHHLEKLKGHVETRFLKINAAKTPFFVAKLGIRTMPTVVCFFDGKAEARLVGFDGLTQGLEPGKEAEFDTVQLEKWLGRACAIDYDESRLEDQPNKDFASRMMALRQTMMMNGNIDDDLDSNLSSDD